MASPALVAPTAEDLRRRVAANTKARRLELGRTQKGIAGACDLSPRHYQKLEAGETNANLRTLVSLAEGLGVTVVWLLEDPATRQG